MSAPEVAFWPIYDFTDYVERAKRRVQDKRRELAEATDPERIAVLRWEIAWLEALNEDEP